MNEINEGFKEADLHGDSSENNIKNDIDDIIKQIYEELKSNDNGEVANYIPQLGNVNPECFGISVCAVNGHTYSIGDSSDEFCMQSCSKPLSYCIARQLSSLEYVHQHVGYEPSGQAFNTVCLNRDSLPHNPMINSGAIMVCSLIKPELEPSDRFEIVSKFYKDLCGNQGKVGFDNCIFLSEQHHADRNMSLAYHMREKKAFERDIGPSEIQKHLNLYFQCCSITITAQMGAVIAATLANGGTCPITGQKVFDQPVVKDCLSLMYTCGMYDYSGQFAFEIGLPAKSGVSGCLFIVIPNRMGICVWSPRLDEMGNTVRGVEFCKRFNQLTDYRYHIFHTITSKEQDISNKIVAKEMFINACATGKINDVQKLSALLDINEGDYDKRTPLHLAAEEGNIEVVDFLLKKNATPHPKDRWGNTPLYAVNRIIENEEERENIDNYTKIAELLNNKE